MDDEKEKSEDALSVSAGVDTTVTLPSGVSTLGSTVYAGDPAHVYVNDGTTWVNTVWEDPNTKICKRLDKIEERLAIIHESEELEENLKKFPALKEAYKEFKLVEALCKGKTND